MRKQYVLENGTLQEGTEGNLKIDLYSNPEHAERQELLSRLDMDEHDLASALDPDEVSRIDYDGERLFIVWKKPNSITSFNRADSFQVSSVGLIIDQGRLIVVQAEGDTLIEDRKSRSSKTLNELLIRILIGTVQHYLGHLRAIKHVSRELQVKLNSSMGNEVFLQMFGLSESLVYYLDALEANAGVLTRFRNLAPKLGFTEDESDLLEDLIIDNHQCQRQAEIYATILSGLMDARGNIINNNMNALLKNLTIINIVFLPLNLIASMGGMSEYSHWTKGLHWILSYLLFSVGLLGLGFMTWWLLNRKIEHNRM